MAINVMTAPDKEKNETKTLDEVCKIVEGNILEIPFRERLEEFCRFIVQAIASSTGPSGWDAPGNAGQTPQGSAAPSLPPMSPWP